MSQLKQLTLERCFPDLPEVLITLVFTEIEKMYRGKRKQKPEPLFILAIKAELKRKSKEDVVISALFDIICDKRNVPLEVICKRELKEPNCKPNKFRNALQASWNYLFGNPIPIFKPPTLRNFPEVMEAVFEDKFPSGKGRMHIHILKKSFRVRITDWERWSVVVDAPHKDGIKYGTHWPYQFAHMAFRKKMNTILVELECSQERHEGDMKEAMDGFLKKLKRRKVPVGWESTGKEDVSYTLYTCCTQGKHIEAEFLKVKKWSTKRYNWGYIVP